MHWEGKGLKTGGVVVILLNGLPSSISLTFSVSMSDGVKSSLDDLWIFFTQDSQTTNVTLIYLWG